MDDFSSHRQPVNWARTRDILICIIAAGVILYAIALILRNFLTTILIFLVAAFVAFAIVPLVNGLVGQRVPRWLAILLVYLGLFCGVIFGGYWIGNQLLDQLSGLIAQVPTYTAEAEQFLGQVQSYLESHGVALNLQNELGTLIAGLQSSVTGALGQSLKIVSGLTTAVVSVVLVIFFSIYLVSDADRISRNAPRLVPSRYGRVVRFVQVSVSQKVGGFIRGQILMAIIIGVTTGLVAWILRVHFPFVLGVLAFFFELIPTIGPILIGISLGIVSIFQSVLLFVEVIVFYIILHTLESNVLGPRIVGQAVGLPPFVSLIAIIAGAEVGGILGALFAVPAAALFVALVGEALDEWKGKPPLMPGVDGGNPDEAGRPDEPPVQPPESTPAQNV